MIMKGEGYQRLWRSFGLSYASFLTLPRVLLHEMPDEWQDKMAELLEQLDEAYPNHPDVSITCRATKDGRLTKFPSWMLNYRHPQYDEIEKLKRQP